MNFHRMPIKSRASHPRAPFPEDQENPVITFTPFLSGNFSGNFSVNTVTELRISHAWLEKPFIGCINNIKLNKAIASKSSEKFFDTVPCNQAGEEGVYFQNGLVQLYEEFDMGLNLSISMDIKPKTVNSILTSMQIGSGVFLNLQLLNGTVVFSINRRNASTYSTYKLQAVDNLADGKWHTVTAVKSFNNMRLCVDDESSEETIGVGYATLLSQPLYIGGNPDLTEVI